MITVILTILISSCIFSVLLLVENKGTFDPSVFFVNLISFRFLLLFVSTLAICVLMRFFRKRTCDFLFRFRWPIAVVLFLLGVYFQVSGSSFNCLHALLGESPDQILFGIERGIRSDEYAVNTPLAFSQYWNNYSYFSNLTRATNTDMFLIYGQPVFDIAVLLRPFHWGYLLFGSAYGLAFFWCGRLIFLFMISFEFGYRILTSRSRVLSVLYALLVSFSAQVQWWFAINGLIETLLFGQLALLFTQQYLQTDNYRKRFIFALLTIWSLGTFILVIYPAWEIIFAYIFLALFIGLLVQDLPKSKKSKIDILIVLFSFILLALILVHIFTFSKDAIQTELNTFYPGNRLDTGGNSSLLLFAYPITLLTCIDTTIPSSNVCEAASFFSAFPLSLILPIVLLWKQIRAKHSVPPPY